jgi:hypothetical protein
LCLGAEVGLSFGLEVGALFEGAAVGSGLVGADVGLAVDGLVVGTFVGWVVVGLPVGSDVSSSPASSNHSSVASCDRYRRQRPYGGAGGKPQADLTCSSFARQAQINLSR